VKENREVLLGGGVSEGTVGDMVDWGWCKGFRGQRNVPKAVCGISFTDDNDFSILVNFDVVFGEKGNTIVVTKLTDRN
jgi:hypothetical protein